MFVCTHTYQIWRVCCARTNIHLDYSAGSRCEYSSYVSVDIYVLLQELMKK